MSRQFDAFARDHDFAVEWGFERHDVDPSKKHLCAACGTMRVTGTLFRVFDTRSRQWFEVAQSCFFRLKKRDMGDITFAADYERDLKHEDGREEDENWMQRIKDEEERFLDR